MRPPDLQFWVMDVKGKAYGTTMRIVGENPHTKEKEWRPGKPYLSPNSRKFEEAVAICAHEAGAYMMDWIKLQIEVFWPARKKKVKIRAVEYPLNRSDNTNIQKSVEDALQEKKVPWILTNRHGQCLKKITESEENPMVKKDYWERMLAETVQDIATFKTVAALRGVVMKNDSRVHDIRTPLFWRPPGTAKCVRVSVWEVQPEEYHTKELEEWLRNQ